MKIFLGISVLLFLTIVFHSCSDKIQLPLVSVDTEYGTITVEIDTITAPVTAKNFLSLIDRGVYSDAKFYRVVRIDNQPNNPIKIGVIQGGLFIDSLIESFPPIIHETTRITGLKHLNGTISMARNQPGTASTEFFICIGDQPELDFGGKRNPDGQGFAAFGRVTSGMEAVRKIQRLKDQNQYLPVPVKMTIRRVSK